MRHVVRSIPGATALLLALAIPATAAAVPATDGARTLGDPVLPQLGNGGYDVDAYRITLNYDPDANSFKRAKTTLIATASEKLREFSLDFQDLDVSEVMVGGRSAQFSQVEATPDLSSDPEVTQPMKLVVEPKPQSLPKPGREFKVEVLYSGPPQVITDPDTSIEGWIPACYPLAPPQTCDGAFVVNEPMGANGWFPSNNYPTDKATFDTRITVPQGKSALGIGELESRHRNATGTTTWHWREDDPTSTYLTTATVGDFIYTEQWMTESSTSRRLPIYNAIDASATTDQRNAIQTSLDQAPAQLNFLSDTYGPYPYDSTGAVADRASGVGYALEVATKPLYSGGFSSGNPSININTQLHELSHQWFGNSATLERWSDIWFNEGWANWSDWYWDYQVNGADSPEVIFDDLYANASDEDWEIAPAILDGDPANLFLSFPTYDRGAMTVEGYRQIVGDSTFFAFAQSLLAEYAYGNITTEEFIAEAKEASGLTGEDLDLLDDYFQQWLYGETKPTILPGDFD